MENGAESVSILAESRPAQNSRPVRGLGSEIRRLRHRAGYSQDTLAKAVGVDRAQIGDLEKGDFGISFHALRLIATALGVKLSDILAEVGY